SGVFQVKGDDFVDQGQRQRGKDLAQFLRRTAFMVVMHYVLQADAVAREVDVAVGALDKEFRQSHGISPSQLPALYHAPARAAQHAAWRRSQNHAATALPHLPS